MSDDHVDLRRTGGPGGGISVGSGCRLDMRRCRIADNMTITAAGSPGAAEAEARKAVGDTGKQQRVIKTVHRRGYQFIADVKVMSGSEYAEESCSPELT